MTRWPIVVPLTVDGDVAIPYYGRIVSAQWYGDGNTLAYSIESRDRLTVSVPHETGCCMGWPDRITPDLYKIDGSFTLEYCDDGCDDGRGARGGYS